MHTSEPEVSEPRSLEKAVEEPKKYILPGNDKITAELILAEGRIIHYEIHKLINLVWKKEELHQEWKVDITLNNYIQLS